MDGARIYAESAIREKNQALNYLRLSNRIDAVAQRVNTALKLNMLTKSMSGVVKGMDSALQSMNVEKISQVMDKFEKQFEDLDVASKVMESSMNQSTAQSMPVSQVDDLMKQVADEHGLEFESQLDSVGVGKKKVDGKVQEAKASSAKVVAVGAGSAVKKPAAASPSAAAAAAPDHSDGKHKKGGGDDTTGGGSGSGSGGGGGGGAAIPIKAHAKKPIAVSVAVEAEPEPAVSKPMSADEEERQLEARLKALQG